MFTNTSMTGVGLVVVLVETLAKLFGFEFPEGSVAEAINGAVSFVGFVLLVVGQLRRKDLRLGLFRRR